MKKIIIICLLLGLFRVSYSQEEKVLTKLERFISRTGQIVRYDDYHLPEITAYYSKLDNKIRVMHSLNEKAYFYVISKKGKYDTKSAGIEYEDFLELIKAFEILKEKSTQPKDNKGQTPNYTEHKFVTEDGFQIGYSKRGSDVTWFIILEKYGSDNTVFFKDPIEIEAAFIAAKNKLGKLMTE